MKELRFVRHDPPAPRVVSDDDLAGFNAGVVSIAWVQPARLFVFPKGTGRIFAARVIDIRTRTGRLDMGNARATLNGIIVRAPDGALSRIAGVETLLTFEMMVGGPGGEIGLLLVPVEES